MKVYVLIREDKDIPFDLSFGGVFTSFEKAESEAKSKEGDWYIEETEIDSPPQKHIDKAIEYLKGFGYTVKNNSQVSHQPSNMVSRK